MTKEMQNEPLDESSENPSELSEDELPSKSQLKREFRALFDLGETMADLPNKQLAKISLPEDVSDILKRIRGMPKRDARRRELRYLAKHLNELDVTPIQAVLDDIAAGRRAEARKFHQLEELRDLILNDPAQGIESALAEFPHIDRQKLMQLVRNHRKEVQTNKAPSSSRKLFKYLRELQ
ncbi:MAG: ribosome biogenesis factor YjgA [Pseudomonadales bacterium]